MFSNGNKVLGFGEIMLRLTPTNFQRVIQAESFEATYAGGEANVICSLSMFGHDTKMITKLPQNVLGDKALSPNTFCGNLVIIFVSCPNILKLQITFASPPAYVASKDSACITLWKLVGVSLSIISPKPNTLFPLLNICIIIL